MATLRTTADEGNSMSGGNNDETDYECIRRFCSNGPFDSEDALRRHIKNNHPLECNVCGMTFGLEKRRRKHINEEHDL